MSQGSQESLNSEEKQPLLQQLSPERNRVTEPLVCQRQCKNLLVQQKVDKVTKYLEVTTQSNTESETNETICQNGSFQDEKLIPSNPPQAHRPISNCETMVHLLKGNIEVLSELYLGHNKLESLATGTLFLTGPVTLVDLSSNLIDIIQVGWITGKNNPPENYQVTILTLTVNTPTFILWALTERANHIRDYI